MEKQVEVSKIAADSLEIPYTLLSRLELAEEEIEGFDKNRFVTEAVAEKLEALEKKRGKVLDYSIEVCYLNDESL